MRFSPFQWQASSLTHFRVLSGLGVKVRILLAITEAVVTIVSMFIECTFKRLHAL